MPEFARGPLNNFNLIRLCAALVIFFSHVVALYGRTEWRILTYPGTLSSP